MINRYASLRQGLVGAWCPSVQRCGSGFTLTDLSGYGNNGSLVNMDPGTDWVASGSGLALDFDGSNDYINLGNVLQFDTGSKFSIFAWIKNTTSANANIISKQLNSGSFAGFGLGTSTTGKIQQFIYNNGLGVINDYPSQYNDGVFHLIGYTYSATNSSAGVTLYVDGFEVTKTNVLNTSASSIASSTNFQISGRAGANSVWSGQLDDIRIYNRALTPSEIQLLYTGGRGVGLAPERIKHRRKITAATFKAAWARRQQHIGSGVY